MLNALRTRLGDLDKYFNLGGTVVRSGARLVFGVSLARLAGPEAFAGYIILFTAEIIVGTLTASIHVNPLISVLPGLNEQRRAALAAFVVRRHFIASVAIGLLALAGIPLVELIGVTPWTYLGFCAALICVTLANVLRGVHQSTFASARTVVADGVALTLPAAGIAVAWGVGLDPMACFWWAYCVGWLIACVIMRVRRTDRDPVHPDDVNRFRSLGPPMLTGSLAYAACSRTHPFLLAAAAGQFAVSLFGAAGTLIGPMRMLSMALGGILRPRLALHIGRGDAPLARRTLILVLAMIASVGATLTLFLDRTGTWLAVLVFGQEYAGLGVVLPWAMVFATAEGISSALTVAIQLDQDRGARRATILRIQACVLSLILVWPACSRFGAFGAYLALAAAEGWFLLGGFAAIRRGQIGDVMPARRWVSG